jgi:hypothetical protein
MSSEAATRFPDALASTSEVRGTVQRTAAIPSDHPDSVRHNTFEALSTVIPITEISDEALLEQVGHLIRVVKYTGWWSKAVNRSCFNTPNHLLHGEPLLPHPKSSFYSVRFD